MRQVFSSARVENVEGVAKLLREAGIEVKVTDGRALRGAGFRAARRYTDRDGSTPAVWVMHSNDHPRARQLLRDAGLVESTRAPGGYAPSSLHAPGAMGQVAAARRVSRIKMGLVAGIALAMGAMAFRGCAPAAPVADGTPAPVAPTTQASVLDAGRGPLPLVVAGPPAVAPFGAAARVPDAVARAVLGSELARDTYPAVCIAVDGADAPVAVLRSIAGPPRRVLPASRCAMWADPDIGSRVLGTGEEALMIDVARFVPLAADRATVEFTGYHHREAARYKTFELVRVDGAWRVSRTLRHVAS